MKMDQKAYWVGFNKVRGIGAVRTAKLLAYFGSLSDAWNASSAELLQAGLGKKIAADFLQIRDTIDPESEYKQILDSNIQVVTSEEKEYPKRLKSIEQPPPVLYIRGLLEERDEFAVAIVGTRQNTSYGRQVTSDLSAYLVRNGITVISGLARGIDSIAHTSALNADGRTLAVLGCGVDVVYPPEHRKLYNNIQQSGALISDYFPGTQPEGINFPPRNRIISGLSLAVVVIEAGEKSGALITGEFAASQGREVFAVPGPIYAPKSKGTNRLIRDGALPLNDFEEILAAINLEQIEEYRYAKKVIPQSNIEVLLIETLKNEPRHINDIKAETGLSMEKISASLVMMELRGLVKQTGNMTYISIGEESADYEAI